jgi:hypothetical protein
MTENDKLDCIGSMKHGLQRTAEWRHRLSQRFPLDQRNAAGVDLLRGLANQVADLSADDWRRLEPHFALTSRAWETAVSEASRLVGFRTQSPELASFVRNLIGLLAEPALT